MVKTSSLLLLGLFLWLGVQSQQVLEQYIRHGLDSNLALRQKNFDIARAQLDLERAKTLFYPQANFNAQYTLANGGRTQDIPIGDLLNTAYSTLNDLTASNKFPQVQNQRINFLPNNFHDTRVEVTMPIYNPEIKLNREIKSEMINSNIAAVSIFKRDLVRNIKQAYYGYLQAIKSVAIYTNALVVVNENLRVNQKLVKNAVATLDVVLKAKAQVSQVQTSLTGAQQEQKNAAAYFNFLLNRPLQADIENDSTILSTLDNKVTISVEVPSNREELLQIESNRRAVEKSLRLNESYRLPKLNAFYNVGFQGFGYKLFDRQFYQLGGIQLTWNLYKGNDNKLKVKQTRLELDAINNQYTDVQNRLQLQITTVGNSYVSAVQALESSRDEMISTKEAYRLTDRKYREGQALQIEVTQARIDMTTAEIKYSLTQLAVLNKAAELERVMSTYPAL